MRPRESPSASPILSEEIPGPVYAARKGHAVRSGTGLCASYDKQEFCDSTCLSHNKTYGLYRGERGYWLHKSRYQISALCPTALMTKKRMHDMSLLFGSIDKPE